MVKKLIENNFIEFIKNAMKQNGCPNEIHSTEDIIKNLYYLSKEDSRGSRYIPLQYKRILEKLILGMFNSYFEYEDKTDVYYEKIGDTVLCCANVKLVAVENGEKRVLGHGFHSLSLAEVMPGVFLSDNERISRWKSTVIGGAKSRALHDAGIGLEFYGDIFAPEENMDEEDLNAEAPASEEKLPSPTPKRGRPKKETAKEPEPETVKEEAAASVPEVTELNTEVEADVEMTIEVAKEIIADIGNYAGMSLGEIYNIAPKNIVFLMRNSTNETVKEAALCIIKYDPELSSKFAV